MDPSRDIAIMQGLLWYAILTIVLWVPALLIRYALLRRPLKQSYALIVTATIWFVEMLACLALLHKAPPALLVAAFFSFSTLKAAGSNSKSERFGKSRKETSTLSVGEHRSSIHPDVVQEYEQVSLGSQSSPQFQVRDHSSYRPDIPQLPTPPDLVDQSVVTSLPTQQTPSRHFRVKLLLGIMILGLLVCLLGWGSHYLYKRKIQRESQNAVIETVRRGEVTVDDESHVWKIRSVDEPYQPVTLELFVRNQSVHEVNGYLVFFW
ncbi:MAG: hypothetical protein MOB07_16975 [Acidobacteria bacterium]|nr:hypothetical protein [Acidobacteriota bacterium]